MSVARRHFFHSWIASCLPTEFWRGFDGLGATFQLW